MAKTISSKTQAPQSKTKVADKIERSFFASAMDDARITYAAIMTDGDQPSAKRVLIAYVVGFVATCAVIYYMIPYVLALMVIAELFTGFAFLGFLAGVIALIFTWWASAKLGSFINEVLTARVVERGALRAWNAIIDCFPSKVKLA